VDIVYTVGHSNLSQDGFIDLLQAWGIEALIDIRARPASRRHPHFDSKILRNALAPHDITYRWAGRELGGMRSSNAASPHRALPDGLRGYADHTRSRVFTQGVTQLLKLVSVQPVTVMCAEREPGNCHRSLLSDYLSAQHGVEVRHLLSSKEWRRHELRPEARTAGDGLVYDRNMQSELAL